MPNLTFSLYKSKVNKNGLAPIFANVSVDGTDIKKNTSVRIRPAHWNPNPREEAGIPQYVRKPRADQPDNNYTEFNQKLKQIRDDAKTYFLQCDENNIKVTPDIVRDYFAGKIKKFEIKSFWDAVDEYQKLVKIEMESSTSRTKKAFFTFLKTFQEATGFKVSFDRMNMQFFNKYKIYVLETQDKSWNYLSVQMRILKAFLTWAAECNYYKGHEHHKFKVPEKAISVVALNYDELMKLYNFEFKTAAHRKARDIFCFSCFTGLRVSDVLKLDADHVGNGMISLVVQKTKESLEVPIFPETQQIIDRYSEQYRLLPRMSEQRVNLYIKECCKLAGITTPVKYKYHPKGQMEEKTFPKYELIHTHTGRKTFISVSYKRGLDIEMIKSLTGIRSESTIKKYLTIDQETKRERSLKAWGNKRDEHSNNNKSDIQ